MLPVSVCVVLRKGHWVDRPREVCPIAQFSVTFLEGVPALLGCRRSLNSVRGSQRSPDGGVGAHRLTYTGLGADKSTDVGLGT